MSLLQRLLRWSSIAMGVLFGLYLVAALVMILWPQPKLSAQGQTAATEDLIANGVHIEQIYAYEDVRFTARDGVDLAARYFPADSQRIVVMVHGVTGSSQFLNEPAGQIREATGASVYALDLRGHGDSGGQRGGIDYVGQYEDDLADVLAAIRQDNPEHELIVLGYSMGGAVVLRHAAQHNETVDGYVLVSPNLGPEAPTARTDAPVDADPDAEPFLALHIPRIIGIAFLGGVGDFVFGAMPTMFFNLPEPFVNTYSYRAMMNSTPDYAAGFEAIDQLLLVIVGSEDETMQADVFPTLVGEYSDGVVHIVDGANHDGILYSGETISVIDDWMLGAEIGGLGD
ncbi:MAG: alpha/beta fold hydrolase [Caldilineaceae bacterium]|nr:alpha/beta fold hydrolase [Caldilineaceae bacterium]